jgi:hypothetical protein
MKFALHARWFAAALFPFLFSGGIAESALAPAPASAIVVGFVGGFVRHNDAGHREVQLADELRRDYRGDVAVEVFANHAAQAHDRILSLLDADRDGNLSGLEKSKARIVLYGHSWGASEVVATARTLDKDGIPVLLTIQVDSVRKPGENDAMIPANVAEAINFYQLDGLLHGRQEILASDPGRTRILGNFRSSYKTKKINCDSYPWYARMFMGPHIQIEADPGVWNRVESLIRSKLKPIS